MDVVRQYSEDDYDEFVELMSHWGDDVMSPGGLIRSSLDRVLSDCRSRVIVAIRDGRISGYAQYGVSFLVGVEPYVEVMQILVSTENRSSGIGHALMNYIEEDARKMNITEVRLSSQVYRSRAHVFYERLGYEFYKVSKFYQKHL